MAANKKLGNRIKQARENKNMTQEALAAIIPCSLRTLERWEKGKHMPGLIYKKRLKQILGVEI